MDELKAPSLLSLLESDRGSSESLLAGSLQLDSAEDDLDDVEYSIPPTNQLPSLESVLCEFEADSDNASELYISVPTPSPSIAEDCAVRRNGAVGGGSIMRNVLMHGISGQLSSAADRINSGLATACAISTQIAVGTSHGHILNFDITQSLRWAHQDKHGQGAVSALAFNADCSRLLAGYARGLVTMIDAQSGNVLRQLFDMITPNTGVLNVKWTSHPALALCADSGGSVWSLSFTRKLGVRGCTSRCLFSGARGEVCAVEPLVIDSYSHHELNQYCIIALATLSKYFIVMIRPRLKVIKYHILKGPADCLPLIAWQMVLIQAADTTRSIDPVIAVGRGNQIYFHQLFIANGRMTLVYLRHVQVQTNLLSAHWLGPKCIGCIDTSEILHLFDVRSSKELECYDMANARLVYASAQFKGLATGGNVSPALAYAGTHACYNSIAARGTQLYVLGARSLNMVEVRTWTERIGYLVKHQRWQEACDLALDGYRITANRPKRREQAKERIIMLFKEYVAASARAPDYSLGAIIKCLIAIGELDMLWTQLWDRIPNNSVFLQQISEYIENGDIQSVSTVISQALVDYWLQIEPNKLEEIVLKLDWTCLDLNQVIKAAKYYKLYRAQIYLNTHALSDYTISLTELIPLVGSEHPDLGNSILVYISSCLAGRGYPSGDIPCDMVKHVKHEVLRCLTSLHSNTSEPDELPYPYLRALLKFDTREMLNVISLAFQEKEFTSELGFSHRKRIINILLETMTPENDTWAEIGCLLNFIAQQISLQCLPRDSQLLEKVLNYLSKEDITNESWRQHAEREEAWHKLLENNCLEHISRDEDQLEMAKRARCYYVEEYLLEKLSRYDTILECYLNNSLRHETLFSYIERHVKHPERKIYDQVLANFKRLLKVNPKEITNIVDTYFKDHIDELLNVISDDECLLFIFLQNLHSRDRQTTTLTNEQCEKLLELLCKRKNQNDVQEFLKATDKYRITKALKLITEYKFHEAEIYLYEKDLNYVYAFHLSIQLLNSAQAEDAERHAIEISKLCGRISAISEPKGCEKYWFELLHAILPREDLKTIKKVLLHEVSQYVDLPSLVQLVMSTHNVSGSFGDIKELLMSMLTNSHYETQKLETTAKILGDDVYRKFAHRRKEACRGLWIPLLRCEECHNRLYYYTRLNIDFSDGQNHIHSRDILILGSCGHALHVNCVKQYIKRIRKHLQNTKDAKAANSSGGLNSDDDKNIYLCRCCYTEFKLNALTNIITTSKPINEKSKVDNVNDRIDQQINFELGKLTLKAPPHKF